MESEASIMVAFGRKKACNILKFGFKYLLQESLALGVIAHVG